MNAASTIPMRPPMGKAARALTANDELPRQALVLTIAMLPFWLLAYCWNSEAGCVIASLAGTFLSIRWFWRLLGRPSYFVHLLALGSVALNAILNVGFVTAWLSSRLGLDRDFSEAFGGLGVTYADYSMAIVYATLFSATLAILGNLRPLRATEFRLMERLLAARKIKPSHVLMAVIALLVLDLLILKSGLYTYRKINTEGSSEGRLAWFLPFLDAIFALQVAANALLASKCFEGRRIRWARVMWLVLSVCSVLFLYFTQGRGGLVLAMSLHFLYWCLFTGRRPKLPFLLVMAVLAYFIVPKVLMVNNYMRSNAFAQTTGMKVKDTDIFSSTSHAFEQLTEESSAREIEQKRTLENFTTRPLVAVPLAKCITMDDSVKEFIFGGIVVNSCAWIVPGFLFPSKRYLPRYEGLLFHYFPDRVFLKDISDSIYLYSYCDFGWFGVIVYPLLVLLLWSFTLFLMVRVKSSVFLWLLFVAWPPLFLLSLGEASLTTWFLTGRNTLMFFLVAKVVETLMGLRPRH